MSTTLSYVTRCLEKFAAKYEFEPSIGTLDLSRMKEQQPHVTWRINPKVLHETDYYGVKALWEDYQDVVKCNTPSRYYMDGKIVTDIRQDEDCPLGLEVVFENVYVTIWDSLSKQHISAESE